MKLPCTCTTEAPIDASHGPDCPITIKFERDMLANTLDRLLFEATIKSCWHSPGLMVDEAAARLIKSANIDFTSAKIKDFVASVTEWLVRHPFRY